MTSPTEAQAPAAPDFETWWNETHPYATSPAFVKGFAREAYLAALAFSSAERIALEKRVADAELCAQEQRAYSCELEADLATAHQRAAEAMREACAKEAEVPFVSDGREIAEAIRAIPVPPAGEKE